jgi:hypothetical protein
MATPECSLVGTSRRTAPLFRLLPPRLSVLVAPILSIAHATTGWAAGPARANRARPAARLHRAWAGRTRACRAGRTLEETGAGWSRTVVHDDDPERGNYLKEKTPDG